MAAETSDAVVVFGLTGDLGHKKIIPALHALVRRGHLKEPGGQWGKPRGMSELLRAQNLLAL